MLDYAINLANKKEVINNTIAKLIKKGKNTIIDTISNKIEETLTNQIKSVEKLEKYCLEWEQAYKDKDISKMDKAYKNINNYLSKTIPLEKILNNARKIENIHNLIKNNGNNFEISENEIELSKKLI